MKNILKKEHTTSHKSSFNGLLAELIQEVRFNRENVPIDEFRQKLPQLRLMEDKLNKMQAEIGEDPINYIEAIMDALEEESVMVDELTENLRTAIRDTAKYKWELEVNTDSAEILTTKFRLTYFLEINIEKLNLSNDQQNTIIDICRQVATTYNHIFLSSN